MKLYHGSLADKLESDGKLSLKDALGVAVQITRALKSVHAQGAALELTPRRHCSCECMHSTL